MSLPRVIVFAETSPRTSSSEILLDRGALIICLDNNITKDITELILELAKKSSFSRVVFKDSGFRSDAEKTNIKEILKINKINEFITI